MSNKNVATITVAGAAGCGKSVVAYHILKMLKDKFNIDAEFINESDENLDASRLEDSTKFRLRGNWRVEEKQGQRASISD